MVDENKLTPHRNRVDPLGALHAVVERGALMGNRGCLHDAAGSIRRNHASRRWIACRIDMGGRRRALLQPGRYTELFFLDEATAYAAGHRPCAACRAADWQAFRALWAQVHRGPVDAHSIDAALHAARLDGPARRLPPVRWPDLPPGAMVLAGGGPALVSRDGLARWSFAGYAPLEAPRDARLITPAPLIPLLAAGLRVQVAGFAPEAALGPAQPP